MYPNQLNCPNNIKIKRIIKFNNKRFKNNYPKRINKYDKKLNKKNYYKKLNFFTNS